MAASRSLFFSALLLGTCIGTAAGAKTMLAVNPIRRVVSMMQMMMKKVEAEGKAEQELYDKFMCWCETGGADLEASVQAAEAKIPQLESRIEEVEAETAQLKADLKKHKSDREEATESVAKAKAIHKKESAAGADQKAEFEANIAAMEKAIAALEKGMAGAFLQTNTASRLRRLTLTVDMSSSDRDALSAFLSGGQGDQDEDGYAPSSGEIVGILKQMLETMQKDLADLVSSGKEKDAALDDMLKSKGKEIEAHTKAIEEKTQRLGEAGVDLVNLKDDLDDTKAGLAEDKQFLVDLEKNCEMKKKEWAIRSKMRAEELLAIADTIKLLNDDDALDLFKKTLPSPSLLQLRVSSKEMRREAGDVLRQSRGRDPRVAFIAMSLRSTAVSFEKVIAMIDAMAALLGKEQANDDQKKEYCEETIDKAEDEYKELELSIGDLEKAISDRKELVASLTEDIAALAAGIKELDKQVSEATETRKEENEDYVETLAANNAAKDILGIAKNRLNKFYNPKMYKAPAKRELSEQDRISVSLGGTAPPTSMPGGIANTGVTALLENLGFAQLGSRAKARDFGAPPPPPETFGAYSKKSQESSGCLAMIDALIADLDKEIQEMGVDEKDAQAEYEEFIKDSAEKRKTDSKAIEVKESAKADAAAELNKMDQELKTTKMAAYDKATSIKDIHGECDWLISNYGMRKEARAGEVDALQKAKAVLSGADYSLLQLSSHRMRMRR